MSEKFVAREKVAKIANRSERTIRDWIRDGVLRPAVAGWFSVEDIQQAERAMRGRRGRPTQGEPVVLQVTPNDWVRVTVCGTHAPALEGGLIALSCPRCRIERADG